MKRSYIQIVATALSNGYVAGFFKGKIYTGKTKYFCAPGLNCYSCPGAVGSCPIGSLQAVLGGSSFSFSYYIVGIMILFGVILGRFICGFLCPFGFLQDLIYKVKTPKIKVKKSIDKSLRYVKYIVFIVPVVVFSIFVTNEFGTAQPHFCQWICPVGTLEGGIPLLIKNEGLRNMVGFLFNWKMSLLILTIVFSIFIYRPFCKYICPLGAFYSLFNKLSFYKINIDSIKCDGCKACERVCKMNVELTKDCNLGECIRCGDCKRVCSKGAISLGLSMKK